MGRFIYSLLIQILTPFLFIRLFIKGMKASAYHDRWLERLALNKVNKQYQGGIIFHCVSVGETIAAIPLIKKIQQQYPQLPVTVTSTTPTGSQQVRQYFGQSIFHQYLPFDTPGAIQRFYHHLQPRLLIIIETELWPNLLHYKFLYETKILLANARLSAHSAYNYGKVQWLSGPMMQQIDMVAAHFADDAKRFESLGVSAKQIKIVGNIKFDLPRACALTQKIQLLKEQWHTERPIWVVGSTHRGEDEKILKVYLQLLTRFHDLLLVLVPRHPERFHEVAQLLEQFHMHYVRRSSGITPDVQTQVVLGDTMGELALLYGLADVAFIGGSFVEVGGHNPLEAAALGVPVLSGPYNTNFIPIYAMLESVEGAKIVYSEQELYQSIVNLLENETYRFEMGQQGSKIVDKNRGAVNNIVQITENLLTLNS